MNKLYLLAPSLGAIHLRLQNATQSDRHACHDVDSACVSIIADNHLLFSILHSHCSAGRKDNKNERESTPLWVRTSFINDHCSMVVSDITPKCQFNLERVVENSFMSSRDVGFNEQNKSWDGLVFLRSTLLRGRCAKLQGDRMAYLYGVWRPRHAWLTNTRFWF